MKIRTCRRQITPSKIYEICLLAIPNQISIISMHKPSLVKFHWFLLKLSSRNKNMDVSQAENSVKNWQNLSMSNPEPDLHNINGYTKYIYVWWTSIDIYSSYHPETKIRMDVWQKTRHVSTVHKYPTLWSLPIWQQHLDVLISTTIFQMLNLTGYAFWPQASSKGKTQKPL